MVNRVQWRAYWPVVAWMAVIYLFSTDLGSTRNSGRIIGPVVRFFYPAATEDTIRGAQMVARKGGHLTEYAVLAILLWRAGCLARGQHRTWTWKEFAWIIVVCTLYAAGDEWHQSHVATRQGNPWDVLIDATGAAIGLWLVRVWVGKRSGCHG